MVIEELPYNELVVVRIAFQPLDRKQYNSTGANLICGQPHGHKQGPHNYKTYAITFDGKNIPVSE